MLTANMEKKKVLRVHEEKNREGRKGGGGMVVEKERGREGGKEGEGVGGGGEKKRQRDRQTPNEN